MKVNWYIDEIIGFELLNNEEEIDRVGEMNEGKVFIEGELIFIG